MPVCSIASSALIPHACACLPRLLFCPPLQPPKSLAAYKAAEQKMVRAADYALKQ